MRLLTDSYHILAQQVMGVKGSSTGVGKPRASTSPNATKRTKDSSIDLIDRQVCRTAGSMHMVSPPKGMCNCALCIRYMLAAMRVYNDSCSVHAAPSSAVTFYEGTSRCPSLPLKPESCQPALGSYLEVDDPAPHESKQVAAKRDVMVEDEHATLCHHTGRWPVVGSWDIVSQGMLTTDIDEIMRPAPAAEPFF
jgi:hypothetical protein